jgi:hypothetical protein
MANRLAYHAIFLPVNVPLLVRFLRPRLLLPRRLALAIHFPAMAEPFRCMVCEQEEAKCRCDRYCSLCHGFHNVRLCQDGAYYCLDCREVCDFAAEY